MSEAASTLAMLLALAMAPCRQRLLFASLASSAPSFTAIRKTR